jgi:hypothetical protein
MLTNRIAWKNWTEREFRLRRVLSGIVVAVLLSCYPTLAHAQISPLTVQPSTGRVGVGVTSPQYPLDVAEAKESQVGSGLSLDSRRRF